MLNFVLASELTLAAGAGFSTLYLSFKSRRSAARPASLFTARERENLLRLQLLYGYNPHSFVAVSGAKRAWFDFSTQSCAAYSDHGKIRLVAGDIIASEENLRAAAKNFFDAAREENKIAAFLPATEQFARAVASDKIKALKIGATPYFDLQNWNPRGNKAKHLRANLNQGKRAGITIEKVSIINESFRAEVREVCESWLAGRRAAVKFGWLFDLSPFNLAEHKRFFAARAADGKLIGLLAASPIPARDGWYLEDVLRRADAPNGTTDLLVCEALGAFAADGAKLATLGTAPLAADGEDTLSTGGNYFTKQALKLTRTHLQSIYGFDGLRRFKARFVPSWWESEFVIAAEGTLATPRITLAFFDAILPNGMLNLAGNQIRKAVSR